MYTRGPVIVMELPERLNHQEAKSFLDELQPFLEGIVRALFWIVRK